MKTGRQVIRCALAVALAAMFTGCGNHPAVEGTVTLDDAPVDGGIIQFIAQADSPSGKRVSAHADIVGGKYSISAAQGLTPGTYKVVINWAKKTGNKADAPGDPGNKVDETKESIPAKYNSGSNEMREITTGTNRIDYAIKSVKESPRPGGGRDRNN